jgi:hypothetical protein
MWQIKKFLHPFYTTFTFHCDQFISLLSLFIINVIILSWTHEMARIVLWIHSIFEAILSYSLGRSVPDLEQAILQLLIPTSVHVLLSDNKHSIELPASSSS